MQRGPAHDAQTLRIGTLRDIDMSPAEFSGRIQ